MTQQVKNLNDNSENVTIEMKINQQTAKLQAIASVSTVPANNDTTLATDVPTTTTTTPGGDIGNLGNNISANNGDDIEQDIRYVNPSTDVIIKKQTSRMEGQMGMMITKLSSKEYQREPSMSEEDIPINDNVGIGDGPQKTTNRQASHIL